MKRILLYTDTPQIGGAERQIFLLAKFLDKTKFRPVLAVSNYQQLDKWCENFTNEGIEVQRLEVAHKHDPRHYFQLKKIIRDNQIDILHAHVWNPASCRYAFSAAKALKKPLIITEHDPFRLSSFKNFFKNHSLNSVDQIITVSDNNAELIKSIHPLHAKKVSVIKNGMDITHWQSQLIRFTPEDRKGIKEKIFQAHENSLIITTIAELHERKGLKYLIKAVREIVEEFSNIKLVIVGEGGQRAELTKMIEKEKLGSHVILLGRQKEIPRLLASSNIFALPSLREAFGLVLIEAMLTGLPVVASKVGGIPEIVEDGKTGLLSEAGDTESIAIALKTLIKSPKQREKFALNGQNRVLQKFSAKQMAESYEKIYQKFS